MSLPFSYKKQVQFYETDCMGVVHHSNYLRYFEEARLQWLREHDLLGEHAPYSKVSFAVLTSGCEHKAICRFGDELRIDVQVRKERAKVRFQYAVFGEDESLIATGHTLHIPVDENLRICRIPKRIDERLCGEPWSTDWPV